MDYIIFFSNIIGEGHAPHLGPPPPRKDAPQCILEVAKRILGNRKNRW